MGRCRVARLTTSGGAASGSADDREAVRQRYREALRLSRRAGAAADRACPSSAPSPSTASAPGVDDGTVRERRGKTRHGGVWWPDDERVDSQAATAEQRSANRQRYASAISSSRASAKPQSESMHSKPSGFGFNAIMSELDQLANRDSHYPLFERSVFDQHQAKKAALVTEAARTTLAGPLHDDSGGLNLGPNDSDQHGSVSQRRDYWPATELQALRDARTGIMQDPFGPTGSDSSDWGTDTWDSISGCLAMQGYNRSGPECAAASAADIAALAPGSSAVGDSGFTLHSDMEPQPNAQDVAAAEQQALLKQHSEETLRLVDKSAAAGRLRPILSEADIAMAATLKDGAAAALSMAVDAAAANTAGTGKPADSATDHDPSKQTSEQSMLAARVEAVAGTIVRQCGLLERDAEARVVLLAVLASEHVLIFGPPGTGKTTLCRQVASVFGADANSSSCSSTHRPMRVFERLVTRFSVPEELLGPLSLSALREDTHARLSEGYLGTANIAFLDEIFKASSSLLNCLLEILADRHTTEGANAPVHSPLVCMMGTAGVLPDEARPGGELAALFDRFLLRMTVQPLSLAGRMQMIDSTPSEAALTAAKPDDGNGRVAMFSALEAATIRKNAVDVTLPRGVMKILVDTAARQSAIQVGTNLQTDASSAPATGHSCVSDRRIVACASLLRVIAYTSGRSTVHPLDCLLLRHCLPQHDADTSAAADRVTQEMLAACVVSASAAKELRTGLELQTRILTHLATAPSRSPAHGSSRDWRERPVGVLAAAVGPGLAGGSSGASSTPASLSTPAQQHLEVLDGLHQQIAVQVQRMARSTTELQGVHEEARVVLLSHPWLSSVERTALSAQLKKLVDAHVDEVHQICVELLSINLWLQGTKKGSSSPDKTSALSTKQDASVGSALLPLLSLMPRATASVLRDLLTSSPDDQRSALRLVQAGGFHAHMMTGGTVPRIQTYSNPKQRGAIEMWASPHGGGMP
eukprot:COSAG02_NODE_1502_length_12258_cov_12.486142_11_plen_985_part_00